MQDFHAFPSLPFTSMHNALLVPPNSPHKNDPPHDCHTIIYALSGEIHPLPLKEKNIYIFPMELLVTNITLLSMSC